MLPSEEGERLMGKLRVVRNIQALRLREIRNQNKEEKENMGLTLTKVEKVDCPNVSHTRCRDVCKVTTDSCLIEHGLYRCEYYDDFLEKVKEE